MLVLASRAAGPAQLQMSNNCMWTPNTLLQLVCSSHVQRLVLGSYIMQVAQHSASALTRAKGINPLKQQPAGSCSGSGLFCIRPAVGMYNHWMWH
jgi:hypothetical protein